MTNHRWVLLVLAATYGSVGCSSDPAAPVCEAGGVQRCPCVGGADGVQVCASDGTRWGVCDCGGVDAGPDAAPPTDAEVPDGALTDGGGDLCSGGARVSTVQEIAQGVVGAGVRVHLESVVATSQLFLVRRTAATGTCLWGVFVSAPGLTIAAPYTGLLVVMLGTPASTPDGGASAYCPQLGVAPVGSAVPEDVQPGDVLDLFGDTAQVLPADCVTPGAGAAQWQLANVCRATRVGTTAVPEAAVIAPSDVARLVDPADITFHGEWAGARIRVENVSALPASGGATCVGGGSSVSSLYGDIVLESSALVVSEKLYYRGYLRASQPCKDAPWFCTDPSTPFAWTFIQGLHRLDPATCQWSLAPNDKCADFYPASSDCTTASCAPY